ncbi:MAG: DnaD domain protein [Anaerolineae bacterium]|nr:DnaD domain protein [Anaerolineae bacterium]
MKQFRGFRSGQQKNIWMPEAFFTELLPEIDDLAELKITLFSFWALQHQEGDFRYLTMRDFRQNKALMSGLARLSPERDGEAMLEGALRRAAQRGTLLRALVPVNNESEILYFANTPQGRDALRNVEQGNWNPAEAKTPEVPARPNIYQLYEGSIGTLTPMIADELKDAEIEFPQDWLAEAFGLAVEQNKRSWRYIRAILERWNREGKDGRMENESESLH